MNDNDREDWVNNDEDLYRWWRGSRCPIRCFVRDNRQDIDAAIARRQQKETDRGYR